RLATEEKLTNQRLGEIARDERAQVVDVFAYADEQKRNGPLPRDRANHPALGGAIELGDDEAGEAERVVEGLDLRERVLPGVGVEHAGHGPPRVTCRLQQAVRCAPATAASAQACRSKSSFPSRSRRRA